jgi:hypothetical protein
MRGMTGGRIGCCSVAAPAPKGLFLRDLLPGLRKGRCVHGEPLRLYVGAGASEIPAPTHGMRLTSSYVLPGQQAGLETSHRTALGRNQSSTPLKVVKHEVGNTENSG